MMRPRIGSRRAEYARLTGVGHKSGPSNESNESHPQIVGELDCEGRSCRDSSHYGDARNCSLLCYLERNAPGNHEDDISERPASPGKSSDGLIRGVVAPDVFGRRQQDPPMVEDRCGASTHPLDVSSLAPLVQMLHRSADTDAVDQDREQDHQRDDGPQSRLLVEATMVEG